MVKLLLDLRRATSHIPLGVRRFIEGDLLSVNSRSMHILVQTLTCGLASCRATVFFVTVRCEGRRNATRQSWKDGRSALTRQFSRRRGAPLLWRSLGCVTGGRSIADSQGCVGDAQRQGVSLSEEHQHRVPVSLRNGGENAVHIRLFQANWASEVFAGTCIITSILAEWDVPPASLVANLIHEWMDLLNPIFVYLLLGLILEGQPHLVFVVGTTVWYY